MTESREIAVTDAPATSPFAMITGDASAMVCEGDVCNVPGPMGE